MATELFEEWLLGESNTWVRPEQRQWVLDHLPELQGHDLMCWDADWELGQLPEPACHGVILLKLANHWGELA